MHAAKRLCVGGVFGVLSVLVFQVQLVYGQENGVCDLKISRGNVKSLLVEVHCLNHAPSDSYYASWEYKQSIHESWKPLTNVGKHRHINALYFLKGLLPNTLYYIRAFLPHLGKYTAIQEGWTCPTVPPPVAALREGGAGPGWLDVRWNRPTELCGSILIFLVRYNVVDLPPGPEKVFGIINTRVGYASILPSHPCPDSEFCVLFTDRVQPGRKHTVEVRTKRYDVDEHAEGEPRRITVLADSEVAESLVNASAKRSAEHTKAPARRASDFMLQDVVLPLWILVLVGGMSFILLLIAIACLCTSFRRKNSLTSNNIYGPVRIEEMPSSLSLPVIHIYDYPQLPLKKENSTFCC